MLARKKNKKNDWVRRPPCQSSGFSTQMRIVSVCVKPQSLSLITQLHWFLQLLARGRCARFAWATRLMDSALRNADKQSHRQEFLFERSLTGSLVQTLVLAKTASDSRTLRFTAVSGVVIIREVIRFLWTIGRCWISVITMEGGNKQCRTGFKFERKKIPWKKPPPTFAPVSCQTIYQIIFQVNCHVWCKNIRFMLESDPAGI